MFCVWFCFIYFFRKKFAIKNQQRGIYYPWWNRVKSQLLSLQINTVMDVLDKTRNHNGPFLFVEEDHYMAPSFLHALNNLAHFKKKFVSYYYYLRVLNFFVHFFSNIMFFYQHEFFMLIFKCTLFLFRSVQLKKKFLQRLFMDKINNFIYNR